MDNLTIQQQQLEQSLFSHLAHNLPIVTTLTLQERDFSTPFRGSLYTILRRIAMERTPFERRMIHRYLENRGVQMESNWSELFSFVGEDVPGDTDVIRHYARLLADVAIRQSYGRWILQHETDVANLNAPMSDVLQRHASMIAETQGKLTEDIAPTVAAIYEREQNKVNSPYFPSGLEAIDNNVHGLRSGHIWVISGPYKSRKTTVALNIVKNVLQQGKHVMYIALEDDDMAFFNKLVAIWDNISHVHVENNDDPAVPIVKAEVAQQPLRIYDARKGVHNWKLLPSMVAADKLRYGQLDLLVIDYIQAYSTRYEELQQIVPMIQRLAGEQETAVLVLSQMSNQDLQDVNGSDTMLRTKSTGDLGAACHVGIEIQRDGSIPSELMLNIKVARNGVGQRTFCELYPASGTLKENTVAPNLLKNWDQLDKTLDY